MQPISSNNSPIAVSNRQVTIVSVIITAALAIAGTLGVYLWQQASIDDLQGRLSLLDSRVSQLTIEKSKLIGTDDENALAVLEADCKAQTPAAGMEKYLQVGTPSNPGKKVLYGGEDKQFARVSAGCLDVKEGTVPVPAGSVAVNTLKKAPNKIWVIVHQGQSAPSAQLKALYGIPDKFE